MKLEHALFLAFAVGFLSLRVISFWADKLGSRLSLKGILLIALLISVAACLLLLYAPMDLIVPVTLVAAAVLIITCIAIWIS